jgi:hypothetical protein
MRARRRRQPRRGACSSDGAPCAEGRNPPAVHGGMAKPILVRVRSSCRRREDFTGRGFGMVRLRQLG